MVEGIGSKISNEVVAQIEARKAIVSKQAGRTSDDLLYLNSKTGWIRLSSGVNTITDEEAAQFLKQEGRIEIIGDNRLAGYNILQGGILNPNRTLREGIGTSPTTTAEDTSLSNRAAYQNRVNSTGIRPMPGITGLSVQSKNTYGTLREAEVKIMVWTLEDFEMVERIYLRPGFTMLLEWGHTLYVTNGGVVERNIPTVGNKFFRPGITMSQILDEIAEYRKSTDYNYEGMIGYVKNFSWNYRPDGGYECSVNIISTGEILDSLKMRINPKLKIDPTEFALGNTETGKEQQKSPFHFLFSKLELISSEKFTREDLSSISPALYENLQDFTGYYREVESEDHPDSAWYGDKNIKHYWMPLRVYLEIFNKFVVPVDNTKSKADPNYGITKFNVDYERSSKFLTIPEHFSIDPTVCVLAHNHTRRNPLTEGRVFGEVSVVINNLERPTNDYDDVLNILVASPFVKGILDAAFGEDYESEKGSTEIIQEILAGINTALGGINDLSISYEEEIDGGTFFIIDRNNTPKDESPTLTVAGIDSIFTGVNISSKISNEIGSNIAIAAQGSAQNFSENVENILKWNPNVIDRVRPTKDDRTQDKIGQAEVAKDQEKEKEEWYEDVINFFTEFNGFGYEDSDMQAAKTQFKDYIRYWLYFTNYENGDPPPGLVPVELSLQLEGIGGMKIGQSFKIKSGILPAKYQDKFGYIITGLGHSVENNRWLTDIKTLFYLIEKGQPQGIPAGQSRIGEIVDYAQAKPTPTSTSSGGTSKKIEGTVYKNGEIPENKLRYINNWKNYVGDIQSDSGRIRLYTKASRALDDLLAAAEVDKITLKINSAYRTLQDQKRVRAQNCTSSGVCSPPTAPAGTSNHGFGIAVDFANKNRSKLRENMPEYRWLAVNGPKFGFRRIRSEAWHWEYQNIS